MQETLVRFLGWEDPLEKGKATHSSILGLPKNLPAMWEMWVRSLGWADPLEKGKATHSSILAWRIPWTIWFIGSQRVRHDEQLSLSHYVLLDLIFITFPKRDFLLLLFSFCLILCVYFYVLDRLATFPDIGEVAL